MTRRRHVLRNPCQLQALLLLLINSAHGMVHTIQLYRYAPCCTRSDLHCLTTRQRSLHLSNHSTLHVSQCHLNPPNLSLQEERLPGQQRPATSAKCAVLWNHTAGDAWAGAHSMPGHRQSCHLDSSRHHTTHRKWRQRLHQVLQQLRQQRILNIPGDGSALGRHPMPCRMTTVMNCKMMSSACQQTTR